MSDERPQPSGTSRGRHAKHASNDAAYPSTVNHTRSERPTPRQAAPAYGAVNPVPTKRTRSGSGGGQPAGGPGGKKKGGPWRVIFWIALIVLIGSLIALGAIAFSYWQGQDKYNKIAEQTFEPPADIDGTSLEDIVIDWDALRAINADTVGWIYVPGTDINYPIVHTTDNDKYLTTDFYNEKGWMAAYGSIFLAAENKGDFSDANNIIYGHHMNDGSMFARFADFRDEGEFNAHRTIYILTPTQNYRLNTFSLIVCDANDPLAQPNFSDMTEMDAYIKDKIDRAVITPDSQMQSAEEMPKLFTFVTCSDLYAEDTRIVLFASSVANAVPANAPASAQQNGTGVINPDDAAAIGDAASGATGATDEAASGAEEGAGEAA